MIAKTLPNAWTALKGNKKLLLAIILIEFLFLYALTQVHLYFFVPTAQTADLLSGIMQEELDQLAGAEVLQMEGALAGNEAFMSAYHDLLALLGLFLLSALLTWIIFKTLSWHLSLKSIHNKTPFTASLLKFPLLSLFWFAVLCITLTLYSVATGAALPLGPVVTLFTLLTIIIAYFAQISFALIPAQQTFKKTFTTGITNAHNTIPAFLVNALILGIAFWLPFNWMDNPALTAAIILLISIPALAFTRLHMIIATWQKS